MKSAMQILLIAFMVICMMGFMGEKKEVSSKPYFLIGILISIVAVVVIQLIWRG
jgi:hypothetical protein